MSNEIDLYQPGGLQPYVGGDQPLAPSPADSWGNTDVDYVGERQQHSTSPQLFGTPLPPGSTAQDVERAIAMIAGSYRASMANWGHPTSMINAAEQWLNTAATQPPQREQRRHSYDLHGQAGDPVAESFANHMVRFNASQEFVSNSIYFIEELERQQGGQQNNGTGHDQPTAMDGSNSGDPLDSLNNDQYEAVIAANDRAKANTETILRRKWGSAYEQNIALAQRFLDNLSQVERDHFSQYTTGFIHSLNTVECLEGLFNLAVGNIPTHGGAVATEIATLENYIRTDRRRWNNDLQAQARLRALYDIRDGR